jgi:tripeptide aminopeptidase
LRDFTLEGLAAREAHVRAHAQAHGLVATITAQYVNMGPRLAPHPELIEWPRRAAAAAGIEPRILPIRGGTGVDPFLDRGIPVANLGTGYFAPESEKEFTSLQMMSAHARWLTGLVAEIAMDDRG